MIANNIFSGCFKMNFRHTFPSKLNMKHTQMKLLMQWRCKTTFYELICTVRVLLIVFYLLQVFFFCSLHPDDCVSHVYAHTSVQVSLPSKPVPNWLCPEPSTPEGFWVSFGKLHLISFRYISTLLTSVWLFSQRLVSCFSFMHFMLLTTFNWMSSGDPWKVLYYRYQTQFRMNQPNIWSKSCGCRGKTLKGRKSYSHFNKYFVAFAVKLIIKHIVSYIKHFRVSEKVYRCWLGVSVPGVFVLWFSN